MKARFIIKAENLTAENYELLVQEITEWTAEHKDMYLDDVIEER